MCSLVDHNPLEYGGNDWFVIFDKEVRPQLDVSILHTLQHDSAVCYVSISANGEYIATGCNGKAQIFDVQTGEKTVTLQHNSAREGLCYIRSVRFSPDGQYLATGGEDRLIHIYDIPNNKINLLTGHEGDIYTLDFTGDGTLLASGSADNTVRVWDIKKGICVYELQWTTYVPALRISANGRFLALGSPKGAVTVFDIENSVVVEFLEGHEDVVYTVAFDPSEYQLLSGSLDKTIKLWELNGLRTMSASERPSRGVCKTTLKGHEEYVLSVALSSDGQWIVSGSKDCTVQFWDRKNGQRHFTLRGHKNSGRSPFPPSSFVVCFLFSLVVFFILFTQTVDEVLVFSVALGPFIGGQLLATGGGDCRVRIWKIHRRPCNSAHT